MVRNNPAAPNGKISRYDQNRVGGRVKRTASNAQSMTGNTTMQRTTRKKMPGSLTSSINSSESEQGAGGAPSALGGGRRAVSAGAGSQRSVYLHAAAVADIPSSEGRPAPAQSRALSGV